MTTINIDNEENSEWLHRPQTKFTLSEKGRQVGTADISEEKIDTADSSLEEYFYLLIDEGIGRGPITANDGAAFVEAMRMQGYEAKEA